MLWQRIWKTISEICVYIWWGHVTQSVSINNHQSPRAQFSIKVIFLGLEISVVMIRWFHNHLIFMMIISLLITWHIHIEHYDDVIVGAMASQITSLTIVYSAVYSGANQSKHQSSTSLAYVWGIHRGPVNSTYKWPVMWKMFPFDDIIMSCLYNSICVGLNCRLQYTTISLRLVLTNRFFNQQMVIWLAFIPFKPSIAQHLFCGVKLNKCFRIHNLIVFVS